MYDGEKWTSSGTSLPQPLQGSCAVEFAGQILLIAGKNEKDLWQGSKSVWQFDPENETWAHHQGWWPSTNWPHFYHGCSQAVVKGVPGEEQWNKMKRLWFLTSWKTYITQEREMPCHVRYIHALKGQGNVINVKALRETCRESKVLLALSKRFVAKKIQFVCCFSTKVEKWISSFLVTL